MAVAKTFLLELKKKGFIKITNSKTNQGDFFPRVTELMRIKIMLSEPLTIIYVMA